MICNPTASSGKVNVEELAELFAAAAFDDLSYKLIYF
nr:MAG TPA: hypothetical protein [Caudoviricetes sp.]